ncbi:MULTISPECIES: glycosyltransferase family 32 protein [Pseudomonas syringae group]|uniref:glycosyltransferase family 32 protein n=1 Tax=Pseudomonas syringae group TaxID=136849 RepID=UPI00217CC6FB|nr:glycosyltransferase [Pseudomonas syringae group genomosp. 3]
MNLRSAFIRDLMLQQLERPSRLHVDELSLSTLIPKKLIRYWHDQNNVPEDVQICLDSWDRLGDEGFEFRMFNDVLASAYIKDRYSARECEAFARCWHPAMRCDYLRMCVLLAEGGFYVDADDVLLGEDWKHVFHDGAMKIQPMCYDILSKTLVPAIDIWRADLPTHKRIFYVANDPIAAPAGHPVLRRALALATEKLVSSNKALEILSTTGPENFTEALAAHARDLIITGGHFDFELLRNWETIVEWRWDLSYRKDGRNWRNINVVKE